MDPKHKKALLELLEVCKRNDLVICTSGQTSHGVCVALPNETGSAYYYFNVFGQGKTWLNSSFKLEEDDNK